MFYRVTQTFIAFELKTHHVRQHKLAFVLSFIVIISFFRNVQKNTQNETFKNKTKNRCAKITTLGEDFKLFLTMQLHVATIL